MEHFSLPPQNFQHILHGSREFHGSPFCASLIFTMVGGIGLQYPGTVAFIGTEYLHRFSLLDFSLLGKWIFLRGYYPITGNPEHLGF